VEDRKVYVALRQLQLAQNIIIHAQRTAFTSWRAVNQSHASLLRRHLRPHSAAFTFRHVFYVGFALSIIDGHLVYVAHDML